MVTVLGVLGILFLLLGVIAFFVKSGGTALQGLLLGVLLLLAAKELDTVHRNFAELQQETRVIRETVTKIAASKANE